MGRSISPMEGEPVAGSDPSAAPRLIVPMSLQLVIPRRVALQQSSLPLHQPSVILKEKKKFEKEKPVNGKCANSKLSQRRGSPQTAVPRIVPTGRLDEPIPTTICLHASEQNLATYRDSSRLVEYGVSC